MSGRPAEYRAIWHSKPVLREIYSDIYRRIVSVLAPGKILEIGGGSGNFKQFVPDVISSDVMPASWLDVVCDAQRLPLAAGSVANIVMVDVLHHIESPALFLLEAERILQPGGRLIFCEPAITPLSSIFYNNFHPEPVDMTTDPLGGRAITSTKDPWDSNQAIPTLLTGKYRDDVEQLVPRLALQRVELFSFVAYPLSGGFREWSLLPAPLARPLLALEWAFRRVFGKLAAFRMLAVYEKTRTPV
jgi:SAM-dependent methyltransferase